jgi:hypothetical protein
MKVFVRPTWADRKREASKKYVINQITLIYSISKYDIDLLKDPKNDIGWLNKTIATKVVE